MNRKRWLIIMTSIIITIVFSGCLENRKKKNIGANSVFENLDIIIDEENINFDKFKSSVEITEVLAKQIMEKLPEEFWDNDYWGLDQEDDMEYMNWFGGEVGIYAYVNRENSSMYNFKLENNGNKRVKINGIGIQDKREKIEEKWEKENLEVISMKDEYYNYDVAVYNNACDIICTFENNKLIYITYEYDSTGQTVLEYREKDEEEYRGDYDDEESEKKVTYPTEIHLNKKEKQEYARVISEYEEKYGEFQMNEVRKMSYLKLLDLKNDDTVQLMIGYADINKQNSTIDYSYDIWNLEDEKAVKVDTGDSIHWDGGLEVFSIVEYKGQKYIVSGDRAPRCDTGLMYHGYKDGKFGIVRYEENGEDYYAIDGKKVSLIEFEKQEWETKVDASDTIELNYGVDFSDEIHQVKEILNMEDIN